MTGSAADKPDTVRLVPPPRPPASYTGTSGQPVAAGKAVPAAVIGKPAVAPSGAQQAAPGKPVPIARVVAPSPRPQPPGEAAIPAPVSGMTLKLRHHMVMLSFILAVILPAVLTSFYLWVFAADQYHSKVGFAVRLEEQNSALSLLSGLTAISGSSSSDTDILFEFIQSQRLVDEIDAELDLRAIWSKPAADPIFALAPDASLEELVEYWSKMVHLARGKGAGLLEVEVRAFDPNDALNISTRLFDKSSEMINELSAIAREDAISYAREDLDDALERLKTAREAVTRFRNINQLVNPELDIQGQAGLLATLQTQQATTLIEIDMLRDTTREGDPRLVQSERRLQVIEDRIAAERAKLGFGPGGEGSTAYADLVGEYERLVVDREFAERTYVSALANYDSAQAEARRKSRYLAAYMQPTLAQTSIHPERFSLLAMFTLFLFLIWAIAVLVYYSVRDRR